MLQIKKRIVEYLNNIAMDNKVVGRLESVQVNPYNGVVRNVRVSKFPERDYRGERRYRTVFGVGELERLFIDVEVFNKKYGEPAWEGILTVRLFCLEGQNARCIVKKSSKINLNEAESLVEYTEEVGEKDLPEQKWQQGTYRILADIDGMATQSEDIYIIQGNGLVKEYFRLLHAGLDRNCQETEEAAQKRVHSFQMFDATGLKNIRFFLMAQNLVGKEWVYEFFIRVMNQDGSTKVLQVAKAAHFMKDQSGNSILCFGIDLGEQEDFITPENICWLCLVLNRWF